MFYFTAKSISNFMPETDLKSDFFYCLNNLSEFGMLESIPTIYVLLRLRQICVNTIILIAI